MKAVVLELPDHWLAERERTPGAHRDEVWDGVLHMAPAPNNLHQDFAYQLYAFLLVHWARPTGGQVYGEVNLAPPGEADWRRNYRIPDLTLLTRDRFGINRQSHFAGAPAAVVEVRSPGDETGEKLAFYAALGVPEVWVFDRDTKATELRALAGADYRLLGPDAAGWLASPITGVRFRPDGRGAVEAVANGVAERLPG